ncbi:hypothetical protein [Stigmatella aurantiaca]|uniref:Uncharacterized protein n=1 Tax=Stigmatella aurantiaca (strain DW4/3-1) TaxID=378806 RepID=E3FPB1_STIAD|nr:hypothetical protein [Stigmatella aurantiaca]ADO71921.1 uncharacterized protein STAUR_4139 [Stigmatella aurantiaca DW4/3-1]
MRLLKPFCVPPFYSQESYSDILKTAETLPSILSLSHMFERPLGVPEHPVDFSVWILAKGRRDVLAGIHEGLPSAFYAQEPWRRIRDFARSWVDETSPLHDVSSVWLEFDIRHRPSGIPTPLLFFTIGPHLSPQPGLELLQPKPFVSPEFASLRRCWELIPASCRYRTLGIFYSRHTEAIRLIIITNPDEAFAYLEKVGWPGSPAKLRKRVEKFLHFHSEIALHIDVHPQGVQPQVGMEIYVDENSLYRGRGGDCRPLLDLAVEESLCLPEIRDALTAWPGTGTESLADGRVVRVERMFHHVKLVSQLDLTLQAKAYTTAEYEESSPWDR